MMPAKICSARTITISIIIKFLEVFVIIEPILNDTETSLTLKARESLKLGIQFDYSYEIGIIMAQINSLG
jgi:hypothetical protein